MLLDKEMIPQRLRDKRTCKKLSVEQVSAKLKEMGFSVAPKTLYGYEKGVSMPNVPIFIALCDIYEVTDILSAVSAKSSAIHFSDDDWHLDQYNDFFNNRGVLGRIYLLMRDGIPSFSGYEEKLDNCFPKDSEAANFDRLYKLFSELNEVGQSEAFFRLGEIHANKDFLRNPSAARRQGNVIYCDFKRP